VLIFVVFINKDDNNMLQIVKFSLILFSLNIMSSNADENEIIFKLSDSRYLSAGDVEEEARITYMAMELHKKTTDAFINDIIKLELPKTIQTNIIDEYSPKMKKKLNLFLNTRALTGENNLIREYRNTTTKADNAFRTKIKNLYFSFFQKGQEIEQQKQDALAEIKQIKNSNAYYNTYKRSDGTYSIASYKNIVLKNNKKIAKQKLKLKKLNAYNPRPVLNNIFSEYL
jgi:hypothetical protein